jgi:hypothetical protein
VFLIGLPFFCGVVAQAQERQTEWGSVGGGYIYQFSESTTGHDYGSRTGDGNWTSTRGWYVLPTFNITKQVGAFADFSNLYGKAQNIHVELYGPFHVFSNKTRYTPFIFIGPGFIRDSNAGSITHSFVWCTGAGLTVRLTRLVSFQTIPIEYVDIS